MTKKIIILGTVGNCIDILDIINEINKVTPNKYECIGFLDDNPSNWNNTIEGIKVLGPLDSARAYKNAFFVNGIGSPSNFYRKREIITKTNMPLERFETIIHPSASVSKMSTVGPGTVIFPGVVIASHVQIGNHVIILSGSVVNHDSCVGDYTCITSGVCISGKVKIGTPCYLGTGSLINIDVSVGDNCLVGMGSIVLHDVSENTVVVGCPARFLKNTIAG